MADPEGFAKLLSTQPRNYLQILVNLKLWLLIVQKNHISVAGPSRRKMIFVIEYLSSLREYLKAFERQAAISFVALHFTTSSVLFITISIGDTINFVHLIHLLDTFCKARHGFMVDLVRKCVSHQGLLS